MGTAEVRLHFLFANSSVPVAFVFGKNRSSPQDVFGDLFVAFTRKPYLRPSFKTGAVIVAQLTFGSSIAIYFHYLAVLREWLSPMGALVIIRCANL